MGEHIHLVDLVGYEFYQITFAASICILPYMILKYVVFGIVLYVLYKGLFLIWDICITGTIEVEGRGVFITGCDSGFGHAFAQQFDELGFTVFAGCLDEKGLGARKLRSSSSKRLHVISVGVTKDKDVAKAVDYVKKNKPKNGLWGIINNAGMNMNGEVEMTPVSYYVKGLNVNMFGATRVIKAFLPLLRKYKGRIVNITSVHAFTGLPNESNYETAKHGLETLSDSLRLEMMKFGVKVCLVEPGMFGHLTGVENELMTKRQRLAIEDMWSKLSDTLKKTYTKRYLQTVIPKTIRQDNIPNRGSLDPVIKAVEHGLCSERPRTRYLVHGYGHIRFIDQYAILGMIYRILPTWIIDTYAIAMTGCNKFRR